MPRRVRRRPQASAALIAALKAASLPGSESAAASASAAVSFAPPTAPSASPLPRADLHQPADPLAPSRTAYVCAECGARPATAVLLDIHLSE